MNRRGQATQTRRSPGLIFIGLGFFGGVNLPAKKAEMYLKAKTRDDACFVACQPYSQYTKMNNPSHTTSTKCQYQATASNAK